MTTSGSIALVPLVGVAWAECKAIVKAAVEDGIAAGSEALALLDSWRMAGGGWRGLTVGCAKP